MQVKVNKLEFVEIHRRKFSLPGIILKELSNYMHQGKIAEKIVAMLYFSSRNEVLGTKCQHNYRWMLIFVRFLSDPAIS